VHFFRHSVYLNVSALLLFALLTLFIAERCTACQLLLLNTRLLSAVFVSFAMNTIRGILNFNSVVLVVQWLGVGLVIERSLVRLPAGALSSQLGQLSPPSIRGR